MRQLIRVVGATAFVVIMGCAPSGSETKGGSELVDEARRVEQTQIALIEDENRLLIGELEKSTARMRSANDAKAAAEVSIALLLEENAGRGSALPELPVGSKLRGRAGNAQQLRDAEQAHEKARRDFLQRHPGILDRTSTRLQRDAAAEASKELERAVGGSGVGKK